MQTELTQEERHERVLRQFAAKIMFYLPPSDDDSRKVLAYANQLLESFLASTPRDISSNEGRALN